jgi:predicted dehydrogenase
MNEALKVGLLGRGRAAERLHVPALERSAEFDLVAVADLQGARAKAMVLVQVMEAAGRAAEEGGIEITLKGEMSAADE